MSTALERPTLRETLAPGIKAVRAHWAPFLLIQAVAAAIVIAYYQSPALREIAETPAAWKQRYGFLFSFIGGFVAGGLVAELAKVLTGKVKRFDREWFGLVMFTGIGYGITGIQVDILYWAQAQIFGNGTDWRTLLTKTVADMGLFATLVSIPFMVSLFEWRRHGFRFSGLLGEWQNSFYRRKVMPGLVPCWAFWIPFLFCTYALPLKLQLTFAFMGEAAWSVLLVFILTQDEETTS
jgi:hypothetical protein